MTTTKRFLQITLLASLGWLPAPAATLTGSFHPIATGSNVNLSATGTLDWVHWGLYTDSSLNRKAGVEPQISNFAVLGDTNGFFAAYRYADNFNGYSWTDGTPVPAVTNTPTGVWAYNWPTPRGSGFEISVSADQTLQTLQVFVGSYAAKGKIEVWLSDASAPGYTNSNSISNHGNGPGGVYAIDFAANSAGQRLHVRWTLVQTFGGLEGNVTLQAAALTTANANSPPYVALVEPDNFANFTTPTNVLLRANARDLDGAIAQVEFFVGANALGTTTAEPYTITWTNPPLGQYFLTAVTTDDRGAKSVSVPVEVFVHGNGGTLQAGVALPAAQADLTAEGPADWAHWGYAAPADLNHKAGVTRQIPDFTLLGTNELQRYADNLTAFSWTDGTPEPVVTDTPTGVFITGETNGFRLSLPADMTRRRARIYVGGYGVQGQFQSRLSDLSAPAYTDLSVSNFYSNAYAVYTLEYAAATGGQTLEILYRPWNLFDQVYGNVTWQAVTLESLSPTPTPVLLLNPRKVGADFLFSFNSQDGATYSIQHTETLAPANWQEIGTLTGTGALLEVTNQNAAAHQGFYRAQSR